MDLFLSLNGSQHHYPEQPRILSSRGILICGILILPRIERDDNVKALWKIDTRSFAGTFPRDSG